MIEERIIKLESKLIEGDLLNNIDPKYRSERRIFHPDEGGELTIDRATLKMGPHAILTPTEFSITPLGKTDIAPMNPGMINVTGEEKSYRFLPDGIQFEEDIYITLPYDNTLFPSGYSENDIQSFYFNTNTKYWESAVIDTIDLDRQVVIIRTNHFTDYINGIIQIPESPTAEAFVPTKMADIKAANPTAGINIMQPPQANQKGDASISYPLNIPPGRNGMQPEATLSYSSDGGSGWMGLGWNFNVPAIMVDTRWGSPVFDPLLETELYTLNGKQLIRQDKFRPHRHNEGSSYVTTLESRQNGPTLFYERKLGSFSKIERLGNDPVNYHWKVTDTNGTVYYYGDSVDKQLGNTQGVSYWALSKIEDKYGNYITYHYKKNPSLSGGNITGGTSYLH